MADNKISNLFNQLKSTVVGTKTQKIDSALDKAVKDIVSYKSNSGRNGYIELVRTVIAKSTSGMTFGSSNLFSQGTGPAAFGQSRRLMRYKTYDSIVSNINYADRALTVLVDNILSPDDITKISLDVKPKKYIESETPAEAKAQRVKDVIKEVDLERKLTTIIRNSLLYGDFFVELADPKITLTSRSILSEAQNYVKQQEKFIKEGKLVKFNEKVKLTNEQEKKIEKDLKVTIDFRSFYEQEESDDNKSERKKLANLSLVLHAPNLIVKLQSSLFPVCFGYLVFPLVRGVNVAGSTLEDEAVNNICMSILRNLEAKIPQMSEFKDDEELLDIIKHMIKQSNVNQAMEIRYVPPDKMVHFHIPSSKYYPYGESIFDSSQYSAKVLIALETALAIQRLSRSTEKRKIAIEVGLPRDAKKAIESMKEEFRKRKVSLDSFGTVDTIPSMITTFEDVYIPQKDGKPFVDISTFNEGAVDVRSKVDELKFMRDQLTASWGVPPSFIGIEENLSNKAALSEENILFARTVIGYQKVLSGQLEELIGKIFEIINPEEALTLFDNVDVHLPIPRSLQYEREARYMNELISLIESLERVGIPKKYSLKKYLSNIDWNEVKKYEIDDKVDKSLDPAKKEDEIGGLGPGGGFGGAGF
ncbi:MAG: portal protein [Candidatus Thorarchaeota archaeon]